LDYSFGGGHYLYQFPYFSKNLAVGDTETIVSELELSKDNTISLDSAPMCAKVWIVSAAPGTAIDNETTKQMRDNLYCFGVVHRFIGTSGINEAHKNNFKIYPNPAQSKITIEGKITDISLITMLGTELYLDNKIYKSQNNSWEIDIADLPASTYILKINNNGIISHEKIYKID